MNRYLRGDLAFDVRDAGAPSRWSNLTPHRAILQRAHDAYQRRRFGAPIVIEGETRSAHGLAGDTRPFVGEIFHSAASGKVLSVR